MTGSAEKRQRCNRDALALPGIRSTVWFGVLRDGVEYAVAISVILVLAIVTIGLCVVLRPIGILIERSARKSNREHSPNDPSSATRPTGRHDCNSNAMAGFAAAHG
jgi:hypothetical protein